MLGQRLYDRLKLRQHVRARGSAAKRAVQAAQSQHGSPLPIARPVAALPEQSRTAVLGLRQSDAVAQ